MARWTKIELGTVFGQLTVVEHTGRNVRCRCSCGTEKVLERYRLVSGTTKSCGCLRSALLRERWKKAAQETAISEGSTFGRLTVVENDRQRIRCRCTCGQEKWVGKHDLLNGKTTSCGCYMREVSAESLRKTSTTHGGWGTRECNLWHKMRERCHNPKATGYKFYGGRGIVVCTAWQGPDGFKNFIDHMGLAPSMVHTLDRINNDGNYEPGNVRWSTLKEQARNRRNNRVVQAFGRAQCVAAWAEEVGLNPSTLSYRIRQGWDPEDAISIGTSTEGKTSALSEAIDGRKLVVFRHVDGAYDDHDDEEENP